MVLSRRVQQRGEPGEQLSERLAKSLGDRGRTAPCALPPWSIVRGKVTIGGAINNLLSGSHSSPILLDNIANNGDTRRMAYPGGKGLSGVYQRLINLMPPHHTYIETHLGGGAIMRLKRPAPINIGIDLDPRVITRWGGIRWIQVHCADAVIFLRSYSFRGGELVYADPPYLHATRQSARRLYKFEYSVQQHEVLLQTLKTLPCFVMVSGYDSPLYGASLSGWRTVCFETRRRSGGRAVETLWMNYGEPDQLHDYRFLGSDFRERERISRRCSRWVSRLKSLPQVERQAILQALQCGGDRP